MNSWLLAIRPKTLWASVGPVLIGTSMAWANGAFCFPAAVTALLGALFIQVGTNLANDYYDSKTGVDASDRRGPVRVTQSGLISAESVKWGFILCFGLAVLLSVYLVLRAGIPVLIIGVISILSGWLYTAGPKPLSHLGMGDIFVLVFFGPVASAGTYFVQALQWNEAVIVAGLAPGLLSTAILSVNNLRDVVTDRRAGKMTLAVRYGKQFARFEYVCCVVLASIVPVVVFLMDRQSPLSLLASGVCLYLLPVIRIVFVSDDAAQLNEALATTGFALFLFSLVFAIPRFLTFGNVY